jgi:hypothetical protein
MVIVILLAAYGFYVGSLAAGMLVAPVSPVLFVAYTAQTILAFVAAVGVWRHRSWAANVVLVLGALVAATWMIEAFALRIVAYLYAIGIAVLAIVLAIASSAYIGRHRAPA